MEAKERKVRERRLRMVFAVLDQEPRKKSNAGRVEAAPFRAAVRAVAARASDWPKPQATVALDLDFETSRRQPPALWALPKNYLDLLGAGSATTDEGPVLYRDDSQVKMLFVSCRHGWRPDGTAQGSIIVQARTRASALADMRLAAELAGPDDEHDDDAVWSDYDPNQVNDDYDLLPPGAVPFFKFDDKSRFQAWLLGQNDRIVRSMLLRAGHWLLTGRDPATQRMRRRQRRIGSTASPALDAAEGLFAATNDSTRDILRSMIRIELPSLPMAEGGSQAFKRDVRIACRRFVERFPRLQPLLVPLRVTVLVVPPKRRAADAKDLDNMLIEVLKSVEAELKPHAEPWLLAPQIQVDGQDQAPRPETATGLARLQSISGSNTWAYQVLELHRQPHDADEGWLVLIPGLGWNDKSIWSEAEEFVERKLAAVVGL